MGMPSAFEVLIKLNKPGRRIKAEAEERCFLGRDLKGQIAVHRPHDRKADRQA